MIKVIYKVVDEFGKTRGTYDKLSKVPREIFSHPNWRIESIAKVW
jgi:hypothetical protein